MWNTHQISKENFKKSSRSANRLANKTQVIEKNTMTSFDSLSHSDSLTLNNTEWKNCKVIDLKLNT